VYLVDIAKPGMCVFHVADTPSKRAAQRDVQSTTG
jgi:hypothetical protein